MSTNHSDRFPSRKNPRQPSIDYTTPNYYFVTICTNNKACVFGDPKNLNSLGEIAAQGLSDISKHFPNVRIDKYVVMPNHVHAIVILDGHDTNLSIVVGLYKSYVSKQIHNFLPDLKI